MPDVVLLDRAYLIYQRISWQIHYLYRRWCASIFSHHALVGAVSTFWESDAWSLDANFTITIYRSLYTLTKFVSLGLISARNQIWIDHRYFEISGTLIVLHGQEIERSFRFWTIFFIMISARCHKFTFLVESYLLFFLEKRTLIWIASLGLGSANLEFDLHFVPMLW